MAEQLAKDLFQMKKFARSEISKKLYKIPQDLIQIDKKPIKLPEEL